jgi:CRP-like cAMP-binding protein
MQAFFTERLIRQRQASPHAIAAYRDTFKLLLGFAEQRLGTTPSRLTITDLDAPRPSRVRHAGYREPRLLRLVNGSLSQRTAALLIQEARGSVVTLPQSTLAAMLGAPRPSVNRVLRDFERAQVISLALPEDPNRERRRTTRNRSRKSLTQRRSATIAHHPASSGQGARFDPRNPGNSTR